ncbi:MAG: DUF4230 domain-containing protein [Spirochaetaceae bacterium]
MRLLTKLTGSLLVLTVLGAVFLFAPILGRPLLDPRRLFRERERTFSSREVLDQIRDLFELHTVEYVYRMVFPHDFYPKDLSLGYVFDRLAEEEGSPAEVLTPEEHAYLRAYNLAYESGLPTSAAGDSFVVVTTRVRGGYELDALAGSETLFRLEPAGAEELRPEKSRVVVTLPEAKVVELIIEDLNRENYPYPAARVDAEEWSAISSFVAEEARRRTVAEGILEEAEENARAFLTALLTEAGFEEIFFESTGE